MTLTLNEPTSPRRTRVFSRHAGAPMGNKHKAHRAQASTKKGAAYRSADKRVKNRDRRIARVERGLSGLLGGKRRFMEYARRHGLAPLIGLDR